MLCYLTPVSCFNVFHCAYVKIDTYLRVIFFCFSLEKFCCDSQCRMIVILSISLYSVPVKMTNQIDHVDALTENLLLVKININVHFSYIFQWIKLAFCISGILLPFTCFISLDCQIFLCNWINITIYTTFTIMTVYIM